MKDMRGSSGQGRVPSQLLSKEEESLRRIYDGDMAELNRYCELIGKYLAENKISNSQIRNILDEVQKIFRKKGQEKQEEYEANLKNRLEIIKLKLAFLIGKQRGRKKIVMQKLFSILNYAIDLTVKNIKRSEILKYFMEAIVAYHRFHEREEEK